MLPCSSSSTSSVNGTGLQSYECTPMKPFDCWMTSRNPLEMLFVLLRQIHALHFIPKSSNMKHNVVNVMKLALSASIHTPLPRHQHTNQKCSIFILTSSMHSLITLPPSGCLEQQILTWLSQYVLVVCLYVKWVLTLYLRENGSTESVKQDILILAGTSLFVNWLGLSDNKQEYGKFMSLGLGALCWNLSHMTRTNTIALGNHNIGWLISIASLATTQMMQLWRYA